MEKVSALRNPDPEAPRVSAARESDVEEAYARRFHRHATVALVSAPLEGAGPEAGAWYDSLARELDELDVLFAPFLVVKFSGLKAAESFLAGAPAGLVSFFHRGKRRPDRRSR